MPRTTRAAPSGAAPKPAPNGHASPNGHAEDKSRPAFDRGALLRATERVREAGKRNPYKSPFLGFDPRQLHPPSVTRNLPKMAMDAAIAENYAWSALDVQSAAFAEGTTFLGFTYLSLLAQRPEYRVITETIAQEMTREWIKFKSTGDEDKTEKIKQLGEACKRYDLQGVFRRVAEIDGFYGRGHIYIDTGDDDDREEMQSDLGNGANETSRSKITKGKLRAFRPIEAVWVYPSIYETSNPLKAGWYDPEMWQVMSTALHKSRLLTVVGRPVPEMLKPAYSFAGLSLSQMVKPYVDNWLRTRQSISDLVHAFSIMALKTDLGGLTAQSSDLIARADLFASTRDNQGLMLLDFMREELANISAPLGGLDALQAQAQEHMCLTGDTLIETDRGLVHICDVRTNDRVLTRSGWAPLVWSGMTKRVTELVEMHTQDSVIRCTPSHPIFLPEKGKFVTAINVPVGARLLVDPMLPTSMGRRFSGAAAGGAAQSTDTTATSKREACCISRRGKRISDLSRKALMSITWTKIAAITESAIWSFSPALSISHATGSGSAALTNAGMIDGAPYAGQNLLRQTRQQDTAVSPANRLYTAVARAFRRAILAMTQSAASAAVCSGLTSRRSGGYIAARRALRVPTIGAGMAVSQGTAMTKPAQNAGRCSTSLLGQNRQSGSTATHDARAAHTAVVSVKSITVPSEPVYDIEVAPGYLPEFFANGVLVHNSSVSRIPIVKLLGIQPAGLNASSEGEIRTFYDSISSMQETMFRRPLTTCLQFIQLSEWGAVDPEITFDFCDLWQLDEVAKASLEQTKAQTHEAYLQMSVVQPEDIRTAVQGDPDSPYHGLDLHPLPSPPTPGPAELLGMPGTGAAGPGGAGPGTPPPVGQGGPHGESPPHVAAPNFTPPDSPGVGSPGARVHVAHVGPGGDEGIGSASAAATRAVHEPQV